MTAQLATQSSFEPGTIVSGKYRIQSLIGVGGVGRVFLARHLELETEVAIKVLRPEMNERTDAVQRFAREARASVRLRSDRIARVLDVGTHEGKPYFVMEYLVGCSLLDAREQPGVDIAALCEFFIQACEGLADAHAQGVVHRDIKPENLFVVRDASGWRSLKILDFGISKFSLTGRFSDVDVAGMRTEAMMGTPHYISPEQIRASRDVDHRTDLWSLGAVMFEVVAGGILPFREEREVTALVAEVLERPHRSLLDVAPNVPERLAQIVDRCLTKDREQRYQTAAEIALDLLPLAPVRARASVERAVSVMQAAGLMAINGDMESLRRSPTLLSEGPHSGPPRSSAPPPLVEDRSPPSSGTRPSGQQRAAAAVSVSPAPVTPAPVTAAVVPSSSPAGPPAVAPSASSPSGVTTAAPVSVHAPVASAGPVVLAADEGAPKTNKRQSVLLMAVLGGALLGGIFFLSTLVAAPVKAPAAQASFPAAKPTAPPPAAPPEAATAPAASSAVAPPTSAIASAASSDKKQAVRKVVWAPRTAPAATPTVAPVKESKPDPSSPAPGRLELRRER